MYNPEHMIRREETTGHLGEDKGRQNLQRFLKPGEVFLSNANVTVTQEDRDFYKKDLGVTVLTARERAEKARQSGLYVSVRIILQAFDTSGCLLENCAAVVAIPKPKPPNIPGVLI